MRFHEFLFEYDENKNWSIYGPKILNKFKKDRLAKRFYSGFDDEQIRKAWDNVLRFADPTPNLEYAKWISIIFVNTPAMLEDIDGRLKSALKNYHTFKIHKLLQPEERDIYKIRTIQDLENIVIKYKVPQAEIKDKGSSKELYNGRDCRIIVPLDEQAAIYYGQGTKWCTAATESENYFSEYPEPLYIIIPKHPIYLGEKYQFYFAENDVQLMDEQDEDLLSGRITSLIKRLPGIKETLKKEFLDNKFYNILNIDELDEENQTVKEEAASKLTYLPETNLYTGSGYNLELLRAINKLQHLFVFRYKELWEYFTHFQPRKLDGEDYSGYYIIDLDHPVLITFNINTYCKYHEYIKRSVLDSVYPTREKYLDTLYKLAKEYEKYNSMLDAETGNVSNSKYSYEELSKIIKDKQSQFYQYLKTGSENAST